LGRSFFSCRTWTNSHEETLTYQEVCGNDAVKGFWKAGGVALKGKGDHVNIKMPTGQLITIPVSGDLKIGLLKSAIRKAGLDDDEFLKLLKGD
jgi:predicted RNA binding protein YcfA (HicA-like mRNA interferase family)